MKKFALIALPFALAACSQTAEETTVEPTATETAMVEPVAPDTAAPAATDTAAPTATDTAAPTDGATPEATSTPM